ncbi:helix-turn-helix domain-containing protein [Umezawaea tangerina]|uniref:AraC-like DNA-binding protein n=1 Tax=Umezawaea tangerina TaxID=84725 RepID=A0A2T0SXD4_9PSEU|nr:helix-turn-helix domain-containing protein [Umezawaea tangerina]PRY38077.1 AraC-like DNA-binding protein [Umezawaea tangerina]
MADRDVRELGGAWASFQHHSFPEPAPDLAPFVDHFWAVTWDLTGQPPYRQLVVPNPTVQLSFRAGGAEVHGVGRRSGFKVLDGVGRVFGVAFRPGCFRPFLGRPASTITDRVLAAADLFPDVPARAMAEAPDEAAQVLVAQDFLRSVRPERDPTAEHVADVVALVAAEPGITRVDVLAERLDTHVRSVQRLFAEYVGVGPKWVIRRYRLREVTDRMARSGAVDWAGVAAELGYADQAHLARDFTAMVGESPTRYAARYPAPPA